MTATLAREEIRPAGNGPVVPEWTIGDRLRKIRRTFELSQQTFADALRVNFSTLRAWESGNSNPRRPDMLMVAARCELVYGIPAWWTAGFPDPDGAKPVEEDPGQLSAAEVAIVRRLCAIGDSNSEPAGLESPAGNDHGRLTPGAWRAEDDHDGACCPLHDQLPGIPAAHRVTRNTVSEFQQGLAEGVSSRQTEPIQ